MSTERRIEHPDGSVETVTTNETPTTVVTEKRGSGMGFLGILVAILAIGVVGYFLFTMTQTQQRESTAIAGAAESIGNAADNVGEAAQRAIPPAQ